MLKINKVIHNLILLNKKAKKGPKTHDRRHKRGIYRKRINQANLGHLRGLKRKVVQEREGIKKAPSRKGGGIVVKV